MLKETAVELVDGEEKTLADIHHSRQAEEGGKTYIDDTRIVITDKRIYVASENRNERTQSIVDIEKVEFVSNVVREYGNNNPLPLLLGAFLLIAGIAALILLISVGMFYIGLIVALVGLIVLIAGAAANRKKYVCKLIIGTSGMPVEIEADDITPEEITEIQKQIFRTLDVRKETERAQGNRFSAV